MSSSRTLWVGNLSYRTRARDLERDFSKYGTVLRVDIPYWPGTSRPKGFAFLEFEHNDDAEYAKKKMHKKIIDGREVVCEWAGSPPKKRSVARKGYLGGVIF
eukprot:Anaeramoba_ignava/c21272_g2_i1.p1 GENE.c21272_g2_i1~~c21272_g2_i1.p1  ORF type:complete len:102 (-),score=27.33 c21272_g2_i1:397-702(-)